MRHPLIIALSLLLLSASSIDDARKANEAYRNGNYAEAVSLYKKAIDADPDNPKLYFNLASALAKEGQTEDAIRTFEQFKEMTDDPEQRSMADYNIGNILSNAQEWDKAVESYKKALRHMSADEDAKHNYELAVQKKREQEQQQQQNQNSDDQQNQQDQQQQNQQDNNQNRDDNQNQQQQQQNRDQQQNEQQQPQQISKAEAEKILKALEQKEKELLKQFRKQKTESSKRTNEKDW